MQRLVVLAVGSSALLATKVHGHASSWHCIGEAGFDVAAQHASDVML